jgi:hypothetical protein
MKLFKKIVWWLALPIRVAITIVVLLVIYPLYPDDQQVNLLVRELWIKP